MAVKRMVYVCPKCHRWYTSSNTGEACTECSTKLVQADVDYSEWKQMTKDVKDDFKMQYLNTHSFSEQQIEDKGNPPLRGEEWINTLETIGILLLLLLSVGGFILGFGLITTRQTIAGIEIILAGLLMGMLFCAATKTFAEMARDLRAIRKKLEK